MLVMTDDNCDCDGDGDGDGDGEGDGDEDGDRDGDDDGDSDSDSDGDGADDQGDGGLLKSDALEKCFLLPCLPLGPTGLPSFCPSAQKAAITTPRKTRTFGQKAKVAEKTEKAVLETGFI